MTSRLTPDLYGFYSGWLKEAPADSKKLVEYLYTDVGSGLTHLVIDIANQRGWLKKKDFVGIRPVLVRLSKSGRILDAVSEASEFIAAMRTHEPVECPHCHARK